jgi:hypothetical protein
MSKVTMPFEDKKSWANNKALMLRQFFHCLSTSFPQYSCAYGIWTQAISVSSD